MRYLLLILSTSILLSAEMEVDGNLTVTDTLIVNNRDVITTIDSLQQQISSLLVLIAQLEQRIAQLECQNTGIIPDGYCDCFFHTLDLCLVCNGDNTTCQDCAGVPNGDSLFDMCGYCDNDASNDCVQDCNGEWGGTAVEDVCGDCGGDAISENDCCTDPDGNTYEIVQINNQTWMAENMNYNYGTSTCYDNIENNCDIHGRMYNQNTAQSICSELTGSGQWRLPSDDDWKELEMFLGMTQATADLPGIRGTDEGGKLKSVDLWQEPNLGATDEFNFNALPGGFKNPSGGEYYDQLKNVHFWLSNGGMARKLEYNLSQIDRMLDKHPDYRFSVRCVKD